MFGLPGLMCTASQNGSGAEQIIELYGPTGLRKYVRTSLELSRSVLGYSYVVHELQPTEEQHPEDWSVSCLTRQLYKFLLFS